MSIHKLYLKTKPLCKVTFKIPIQMAGEASEAHLVGEFNDWSTTATPMKKHQDGSYSATVTLETGRRYEFRYLLEASRWENDPEADDSTPTPFGDSFNSVVDVPDVAQQEPT